MSTPTKIERWILRKLGLVHGVKGKLEHPVVAEELLGQKPRKRRAFARGGSSALAPMSPKFKIYKQRLSKTKKQELVSIKEVDRKAAFFPASPTNVATKNNNIKKDEAEDFPDVEGGHKRFNRLWLESQNPMASAGRCIAEGDEALYSMGILQECWFLLVNVLTWKKLLAVNIMAEILVIVMFALILTLVAKLDGTAANFTDGVFRRKSLLCLTTVRLSTDSVFGWEESTPSTDYEILLLTLEGWTHWLLLNVFSAVIVARALRPQRGFVFAPDVVVTDKELQIRVHNIRWKHVLLHNIRCNLHATSEKGTHLTIDLKTAHYPIWSSGAMPMTLKHDITNPSSPFHKDSGIGAEHVMNVSVFVEAEDQFGSRISGGQIYYSLSGPRMKKLLADGFHIPRIFLGCKYKDQIRIFRDRENKPMLDVPHVCVGLDSFTRIQRIKEMEKKDDTEVGGKPQGAKK